MSVRIGTRGSNLALWQANTVRDALAHHGIEATLVPLSSSGDRSLGGQLSSSVGQFIHAIDDALLSGEVDLAVHSSKDVPVDVDERVANLAFLERGCTTDLIITRAIEGVPSLDSVLKDASSTPLDAILRSFPMGATFGTVSGRRQAFLLSQRPDLVPLAVRGHVETRISRLMEGRVDALILAEVGVQRLSSVGALNGFLNDLAAFRIDPADWPTAPGQGAIAVHCSRERYEELEPLRAILNHEATEHDVAAERRVLNDVGGGCLFPAGVGVNGGHVHVHVAPENWRALFCRGLAFDMFRYAGPLNDMELALPVQPLTAPPMTSPGPRYISTLNSDRISHVLSNQGIPMDNVPAVDLAPLFERWPSSFLHAYGRKPNWPYLVLTSPFAAKCAVAAAETNPDIGRIPWLAIGEGTARACFRLGVTVAVCAQARNAKELAAYILETFSTETPLFLPRSDQAAPELESKLREAGFAVTSWTGYENRPKVIEQLQIDPYDVLVLSSASSARSWAKNDLGVPREVLCMGENARKAITMLDHFSDANVSVLSGPTTDALVKWWHQHRTI